MKFPEVVAIASLLVFPSQLFSQDVSDLESGQNDRFAIPRTEAQRVTVLVNENPIKVRSSPLYTYDEKVRNWKKGTTWIWGVEGRPHVALNLSTYQNYRYFEFISFSNEQIKVTALDGDHWSPAPNWNPTPIPEAPKPAASRRGRLTQMRVMARRFSAQQFEYNDDFYDLRLLPQPIYRYEKGAGSSLDGSFFGFTRESDLEIILVVEAAKNRDNEMQWFFGCRPVAVNKQEVQIDGKIVWAHERNELNTDTGPYRLFLQTMQIDDTEGD